MKKRYLAVAALLLLSALLYPPRLLDPVPFSHAISDSRGHLLRILLTPDEKYRIWTPLQEIAPAVAEATLLQEDQHFQRHFGINIFSLARAAWRFLVPSGRRVGASTITMQVARVRYHIHSRSVWGKLSQIFRALQLELHYRKSEILEAYLNLVPYGGNVEGIGAASLIYFGKRPNQLNLLEALTLAVIPQSPAQRAPDSGDLNSLMDARRELFVRWVAVHPADQKRAVEMRLPVDLGRQLPFIAPHFVNALDPLPKSPHELVSTLDIGLQRLLERQASAYIENKRAGGLKNAAALLVNYNTMEVKALLGSVDFFDTSIDGQVNGTRAKRSPGSTLKPFLYGLGIDQGLIHPMTMLKDTPTTFSEYDPENFDKDFVGPIKVRDALIRSRNVPALQVANRLHPDLYQFLQAAGVSQLKSEEHYGLALVLGGAEMTLEELVRMYAMLGNGGVMRPLRWTRNDPQSPGTRLLSPEASFMVLDMLKDNLPPEQLFRRDWLVSHVPVAWKTGTSMGLRDAWSIGVFGPYVLGVWVGNFSGEPNPAFIGRDAAGPLLFRMIDAIRAEHQLPLKPFAYRGNSLKKIQVCSISGELPGPFCRHTIPTWFIPGKSPIHTCAIHREIRLNAQTGERACGAELAGTVGAIYEFWPSDLLKLFRKAGIPRRVPPPEPARCSLDSKASHGLPPEITSPRRELEYNVRSSPHDAEKIPFTAVTDSDTRTLYWFIDEKFIGKSAVSESLFWAPVPGRYLVRVVDDQGRSDARELNVSVVQ
jgi:penicillin-binding protein 1C